MSYLDIKYKVNKNGCWDCVSHKPNSKGYPAIFRNGVAYTVGRFIYMTQVLKVNRLSPDILVLHKCDNPLCCNPDHLTHGTTQDNVDDRNNKGRQAKGKNHGKIKLLEKDVELIRNLHISGIKTMFELADIFDVNYSTINNIINRKTRKL